MLASLLSQSQGAILELSPGQAPILVKPQGMSLLSQARLSREDFAHCLETVREWGMVQEGEAEIGIPGSGRCLVRSQPGWLALQLLPSQAPDDLAQLNLPQVLADLITLPAGLVLLGGPRLSGISTTIACLIELILRHSQNPRRVLLCGWHPYVHGHGRGLLVQAPNLQLHHPFQVVITPLMTDPRPCILAAEQGSLVLMSITAPHCSNMIEQLNSLLPPAWITRLQSCLRGLYGQRLVEELPVTEFVKAELARKWLTTPGAHDYPRCLEKQKGSWSFLHSLQDWVQENKLTPEQTMPVIQSLS